MFSKSFGVVGLILCIYNFNIFLIESGKIDPSKPVINFKESVLIFCERKQPVDFCSQENISLMFEIEDERQKIMKMMRMKNDILKKVFNIYRNPVLI